jgi:hypothetical protein
VEFLDNSNRPFTISQLKEHKYRSDRQNKLTKDDLSICSAAMATFLENLHPIFAFFGETEMEDFIPVAKFPDSRITVLLYHLCVGLVENTKCIKMLKASSPNVLLKSTFKDSSFSSS